MSDERHIKIILAPTRPNGPARLFVDIDDESGKSLNIGTWTADSDFEALIITPEDIRKLWGLK